MTCLHSGRGLRRPRREHSRTTASLRGAEAAARTVLRTAVRHIEPTLRNPHSATVNKSHVEIYLRRLRRSRFRREPPKITPLRSEVTRVAACAKALRVVLSQCFMLFADGGGQNERKASCSPPQWGGGELRGSKSRNIPTRQPIPRQKRFRTEGGRSDGA